MQGYSKKDAEALFEQYKPMINKAAWQCRRKYKFIEFEDLQAQCYLIFMECLSRFNPEEASFSTFLHYRLKTINDYCICQLRRISRNVEKIEPVDNRQFDTFKQILDGIELDIVLGRDARTILDFIVRRRWETPGRNWKPSYHSTRRWYRYMYGWDTKRFDEAWKQLQSYIRR